MHLTSLCIYCGSNPGLDPGFAATAFSVGEYLASEKITLIYGGGRVGLMGAVADGALAAGGEVIGVIPEFLQAKEIAHPGVTRMEVVGSMHERKTRMADLADAFVAMPGGIGTLEEIFEVFTWTQLGLQAKPCGLLNVQGFYDPMIGMLQRLVAQGFLKPEHLNALVIEPEIAAMLEGLRSYAPVTINKWTQLS